MTHSPVEVELTPAAATRLDEYLAQVRAALAGAADVNAGEIEADIRDHVEYELRAAPRPVTLSALEAVLGRLGPPSQWGTAEDPTLFHRARHLLRERLRGAKATVAERVRGARGVLWRGPDDLRLSYLSFGIFALGILTFFALFPLTLLVSYFLSRAGIAYAKEHGIALGTARKWLLYPPVVIVSTMLLVAVVAWPVSLGIAAGAEVDDAERRIRTVERVDPIPPARAPLRELRAWQERQLWKEKLAVQVEEDRKLLALVPVSAEWAPAVAGLFVSAGAALLWWTALSFLAASFPGAVRAVFLPLFNRFERHHALWFAFPCAGLAAAWCAFAWDVVRAAGVL